VLRLQNGRASTTMGRQDGVGAMGRQKAIIGVIFAVQIWGASGALAGPWEDGMAAYNRGDYVPAVQVFRAMAREGNAEAQHLLGRMYRRGQGVKRSPTRAFVWLNRAAARGNQQANADLHEMSQSMTATELSRARAVMEACEASDYRGCEY
jgi:TPR repeat protein